MGIGTPRFRPASIFENPRDFGRNAWATIAVADGLDDVDRGWAVVQHRTACLVTRDLVDRDIPIEELAEDLGENVDWLRRKLYGRVPADVGDLLGWLYFVQAVLPPEGGEVAFQWYAPGPLSGSFYTPAPTQH